MSTPTPISEEARKAATEFFHTNSNPNIYPSKHVLSRIIQDACDAAVKRDRAERGEQAAAPAKHKPKHTVLEPGIVEENWRSGEAEMIRQGRLPAASAKEAASNASRYWTSKLDRALRNNKARKKMLVARDLRRDLDHDPYEPDYLTRYFAPYFEDFDHDGLSPREVRLLETIIDAWAEISESQSAPSPSAGETGKAPAVEGDGWKLASKLVWWLAGLAHQNRVNLEPRVGDVVVETTHRMGMGRHRLGLIDAVGELLKIEDSQETGKIYTIRTLEGKEKRWVNAMMLVVDRPNTPGSL